LHRFIISILGLALSISAVGLEVAHGYLLPPQQILEFVTEKTEKIYNFRFEAVVESPDPDLPDTMIRKEMVYYAARPDFLRLETVGQAEDTTVLVGAGKRLAFMDGHLLAEPARHEDIFPALLYADSPQSLETLLAAEQVDLGQVHLGRLGKQIAYVIGGPPREVEAPQFWCDKDNFWPIRLIGRRSSSGVDDLVDIRFLSYQEVAGSIWLPTVIEIYRQDQLVLRMTVQKTSFNQRLPDSLFDMEKFAAEHPPLPPPKEPSEKPAEELEEMRRYLEKKYE
jgi:outer membrane lipoprotein-sorting protein